jgi:hypothetical protein
MAKTSFQFKIYSFIFFILFVAIVSTVTLALYNESLKRRVVETERVLKSRDINTDVLKLGEIKKNISDFNLYILIGGSLTALLTLLILISFRGRSLAAYKKITERINTDSSNFSLNIKFPEEDMFGNLGARLNRLIFELQAFDKVKQERYLLERLRLKSVLEYIPFPVYLLDSKLSADMYNDEFIDKFEIDPKTFDEREFEELVNHVRQNADIYSKAVKNDSFREKILVNGFEFQVEFKTIPILHSSEDKNFYSLIFIFTGIKKSSGRERKIKGKS